MRVLHAYCLNYNIGDYALGIGLQSLMRKYLPIEFIGTTNLQGRVFDRYYISEVVNKKYDLLVIGGGGIIHGKHWPNGWFWLVDIDLIKEITIPFIVYGAGNNYWDDELPFTQRTIDHLRETNRLSCLFSVRNDGSYERIKTQAQIEAVVVPDPGFHVNLREDYFQLEKTPYVIIQVANDKQEYRLGKSSNLIEFIDDMRQIAKYLSRKYTVVLAPHVFEDVYLSAQIARNMKNVYVYKFSEFAFDRSDKAIGYYKYAEFVISMRGHGQIIPISFNKPVIALENHPKHKGLMENLNLLEYCISVKERQFLKKVLSAIERIENEKDKITANLMEINRRLEGETESTFMLMLDRLNV
jgi:polysaccharide pyruvyl transferase WcaK-like protein